MALTRQERIRKALEQGYTLDEIANYETDLAFTVSHEEIRKRGYSTDEMFRALNLNIEEFKPKEPDAPSGFSGLLGNVWTGAKQTGRMIGAAGNAITGDLADVEEYAADSAEARRIETPLEQRRLQEELSRINRDQSIAGQVGDTLSAAGRHKMGTGQMIAEQAPNTVVALGGGAAGAKLGGSVGFAVGGPVGAAIGGGLGFLGGMFIGNFMLEGGSKAIDKAQDGFTQQERGESITEGAKKAGVITAVDYATLKLGGAVSSMFAGPAIRAGARAEAKVLIDAGVDMSSPAAINAALASNRALAETAKMAGEAAAQGAIGVMRKASIAGTGLTMETAGEGLGEYLGEWAATGKPDAVDATIEALSSFTQSAAQTAYNYNKVQGNNLSASGMLSSMTPEEMQAEINARISAAPNVETAISLFDKATDYDPNLMQRDIPVQGYEPRGPAQLEDTIRALSESNQTAIDRAFEPSIGPAPVNEGRQAIIDAYSETEGYEPVTLAERNQRILDRIEQALQRRGAQDVGTSGQATGQMAEEGGSGGGAVNQPSIPNDVVQRVGNELDSVAGSPVSGRRASVATGVEAGGVSAVAGAQAGATSIDGYPVIANVGSTPKSVEPVTVRGGVVYIGKYQAMDAETGEDVTVPEGAGFAEVKQALMKAGSLSNKQRVYSVPGAANQNVETAPPVTDRRRITPLDDARLGVARYREDMPRYVEGAGWAEEGGKLLRNAEGDAVGRTAWVPKSDWWLTKPSGVTEKTVRSGAAKALSGEPMTLGEKASVKWLLDVMEKDIQAEIAALEAEMSDSSVELASELAESDDDIPGFDDVGETDTAAQMRALGFTEEEINAEQAKAEGATQGAAEERAGEGAQAGEAEAGTRAGEEAASGFALESQSEADLAGRDRAEKEAAGAKAKADAEAEAKIKADSERDGFTLTGSDRAADANPNQADIFSQPAEKPSKLDALADNIDAQLDAALDELANAIKAQSGKLNSGVDPAILALGVKVGSLYIAKGVVKFAQYSKAIIDALKQRGIEAEQVKPYLKQFYAATKQTVDDATFEQMDDDRTVRAFDLDNAENDNGAIESQANVLRAENMDAIRKAGADAFKAGDARTPPGFMAGTSAKEWLRGWDDANVANPINDKPATNPGGARSANPVPPPSLKIQLENKPGSKKKTITVNARKAMAAAEKRVNDLRELLDCLG